MKGTFFSADFISDENNNLRLLELNTDTAVLSDIMDTYLVFTDFINLLSTNNITTLHVIYKSWHVNFVNHLESVISTDATFITTFEKTLEANDTIYPTAVSDASDKFILRLAYDENALFDSSYCKNRAEVLRIFSDNSNDDAVPQFFLSGSEGIVNTLSGSLNDSTKFPDMVQKALNDNHSAPVEFFKFDNTDVSSSVELRNQFLSHSLDKSQAYVEKYHVNPNWESNGRVDSIREFGMLYGTNIDYMRFGSYKIQSLLELPTDVSGYTSTNNVVALPKKHYFEYTTNFMRHNALDGILTSEKIQLTDNSFESPENLSVSQSLKSFFISGSPDTDSVAEFESWSYATSDGSFPPDSSVTHSIIETLTSESLKYYNVVETIFSNQETVYSGVSKNFLTFDSASNHMSFKTAYDITASKDYVLDHSGSLTMVSESNYVVLNDESQSLYRIDVEDTDTYFVSSSKPFIVHNAPCFVAGTQVWTENGSKNIEDVVVGEKVITYDLDNDYHETKEVLEVMSKDNENVITYIFENGTELTATPDHPLYVISKGYASYSPQATKEDSGMDVEQILLGDEVLHLDDYGVTIQDIIEHEKTETVYNLKRVADNNNFYANSFLAHNRFVPPGGPCCFAAGTQIKMEDGTNKNIEDVVIGDRVVGWDGEEKASDVIDINHKDTVGSHADACKSLGDEPSLYTINETGIEFTPEHPFLTKDGWKALVPQEGTDYGLLGIGDYILKDGIWEEVLRIEAVRQDENEKVYNFTVKDINSYIANGIVVHNK
tara:strand:- start:1122 stop:3446 length:2325 start_codon:yes stop_codon:yes gene_type:complete